MFYLKKNLKQLKFKRDFENQKGWIIELLVHQGLAYIERYLLEKKGPNDDDVSTTSPIFDDLKLIYKSIQKWIDINDDKVILDFKKI